MKHRYAACLVTLVASCLIVMQCASASTPVVTDSTVELPSGQVAYRDSGGKGIPVIFLHAASGNSSLWEYQIPAFTAAGYRFIAIDYRGTNGANPRNTVARINELASKLGLSKFHLLGTAAGGGVALQYAVNNPEKLRSLVVSNSIGGIQDPEYAAMGERLRPAQFNQLPLDLRELGPSYRAVNPEGVKRWLALSAQGRDEPMRSGEPPTGMQGNPGMLSWAALEKLQVPTLFMTGDADLYLPPAVLRLFTARVQQAQSAVIPDTGHSSFWENSEIFNRTVLAFIARY